MIPYVLIWGGGDLASGVAIRLHRAGICILVVEKAQPLAVRLSVAFAQAVYEGIVKIEDVQGLLIQSPDQLQDCWSQRQIPVLVDPELDLLADHPPLALVEARMLKQEVEIPLDTADLVIGLGPGFTAQENCHAAVETNRGHLLGRVYWEGSTEVDTGVPGNVLNYDIERVFIAPKTGVVVNHVSIGDWVHQGERVMTVGGQDVTAPFDGLIRGLAHAGLKVKKGVKLGDIDPRPETYRCWTVSEKSLAIGGGVLEALLTHMHIRRQLWDD